jgi:hypothetical protein
MTNVGDPGHIAAHNVLREHVLAEAARFGLTPPTLAGPFTGGEPDHIGAHNALVSAIQDVATAGGITVTLPNSASLGDPGHVTDHDAMRAALAVIQAAPAWNAATGGTVSDVTNYNGTGQKWRFHTFSAGATLTVTKATQTFRVFGSGGAGGGQSSGCCGSCAGPGQFGETGQATKSLTVKAYPITVGVGGAGGGWSTNSNPGADGGATVIDGVTYRGGKGGLYGHYSGNFLQTSTDIRGAGAELLGARCFGGACGDGHNGQKGENGFVIVAYRIG